MGVISDAARTVHRVLTLDGTVRSLEHEVANLYDTMIDHEKRLIRIEALIEFTKAGGFPLIDD